MMDIVTLKSVLIQIGILTVSRRLKFVTAEVILTSSSESVAENSGLELTCTYTGTQIIQAVSMSLGDEIKGSLLPSCIVFAKQPDTTLYEYDCPTDKQLKWTIKKLTRANEGDTWACKVSYAGGIENATYNISVHVPVQSVTMASPTDSLVTVRENTETVFVCKTSGGLPAPTVRWYKEHSSPTSDVVDITAFATVTTNKTNDDLLFVTSTLKYTPQKEDNGNKIYCTAKNSVNTQTSARKPLNVQYSSDGPPIIQIISNGDIYKIIENTPGTLSCSVKGGNPLPTLSWNCYNTGSASESVGTSVTKNVTWTASRNQDRSCACQSSHILAGNQTVSVNIQVLYPPDQPIFKVNGNTVSGPISFIKGTSRDIVCQGNGNPNPISYSWAKGGKTITSGERHTFNSIQKEDDGQYSCKVQNTMIPTRGKQETGTNTSVVNIIVLYAPSSPSFFNGSLNGSPLIRNSLDVMRGDTFTIACKSEGQPAPSYRWSGQTSDSQTLSVTSISENANLKTTCTATNTMRETHGTTVERSSVSELTFNVLYPPSIGQLSNVNIEAGSEMNISCPVVKGNPPSTTFIWARNDTMVWNEQILFKKEVTIQDDQIYTCTVQNTMTPTGASQQPGRDSGSFHLNVLYKASVASFIVQGDESASTVTVNENKTLLMICSVDSNPGSRIEILFQDNLLYEQDNTKLLVYNHKNASCLDTGVYTCKARNKYNHGESSVAELTMNVRCYPRPLIPVMENVTSALRTTASLNFIGLAYPVPDPSGFTWKKKEVMEWKTLSNSSSVSIYVSGLNSSLMLKNVSQSDYGQYQLIIENDVDTHIQPFYLLPEGVPEIPTEFNPVARFIRERSALLQWKPGFNGGPEQTFILMYKTLSDKIWINETVKDDGEETMNLTLTSLASGTQYTAVIFARNRVGDSSGSRNTSFSTPVLRGENVKSTGALIGGVVGGVFGIILVGVGLILYRKVKRPICKGLFKKTSETSTTSARDDYADLKYNASYANMIPVYDSLQQEPGDTTTASTHTDYTNLQVQENPDKNNMHASLKHNNEHEDDSKLYVNLNIKRF